MSMTEVDLGRKVWNKRARRSIITRRKEDWYRQRFNIEGTEDLILDLGSGKSPFALPNMVRSDFLYRKYKPKEGINLACLFQELPFADNSFDKVIASWSLIKLQEGREQAVQEALRVIKPGGTLEITPAAARNTPVMTGLERADICLLRDPVNNGWMQLRGTALGSVGSVAEMYGFGVRNWEIYGATLGFSALLNSEIYLEYVRKLPNSVLEVQRDFSINDPANREALAHQLLEAYHFTFS